MARSVSVPTKILQPVILNFQIVSKDGNIPLESNVRIFDTKKNQIIKEGVSANGKLSYSYKGDSAKQLLITIEKDGYVFKNFQMTIPALTSQVQVIEKVVPLDKVKEGYRMVLRNIYFDFNKATLKSESNEEMNRLCKFMKDNSKIKIRIEGHTDNFGSNKYNLSLSEKRAKAVAAYLIAHGISSSRVDYKGYGEEVPLATNDDDDDGREINRRTEFVISKK
jgi:outer membrane protein OmpA-like peptidoglycan-associated protein